MRRSDRHPRLGFTLIEVTLAIVVGVIMVAAAILIYNQAKTSAGNSRAQAKVASLQALVEESMANNAGTVPSVEEIRALWKRKRPDDWFNSPWGGRNAPAEFPTGTTTSGVVDGADIAPDSTEMQASGAHLIGSTGGKRGATRTAPGLGWTGILLYYRYPNPNPYFIWDENRQAMIQTKYYAVATTNTKGERWFYVGTNGGTGSSADTLDVEGDVGDKD